jgi:hypothetical protein
MFFKSTYKILLGKERVLIRVDGNRKYSKDEFFELIVNPRAALLKEAKQAYNANKISKAELDELVILIRKGGLPPENSNLVNSKL